MNTAAQLTRLAELEARADAALRAHGVESAQYSRALCAVGAYESRLVALPRTPEARYVDDYRPY